MLPIRTKQTVIAVGEEAPDFADIVNDKKTKHKDPKSANPEEILHHLLLMEPSYQIFQSRQTRTEETTS